MSNIEAFDPLQGRELPAPAELLDIARLESPVLFAHDIPLLYHQMKVRLLEDDIRNPCDDSQKEYSHQALSDIYVSSEAPLAVTHWYDEQTQATYYGLVRFAITPNKVKRIDTTQLDMIYRHPNGDVDVAWGDIPDDESGYFEKVFGDLNFTLEQARVIADLGDQYPVAGTVPSFVFDDSEGELHR